MHRLFVAVRPPRSIRETLLAVMGGVPGARWQTDQQLHLTVRFIGEADRHCANDIAAVLGGVHHPRLELALDGIGQFERKGRIDTMWAGVTPQIGLLGLHNKIDQALVRIGLAAERRAYLPHITLARFGRGMSPPTAPLSVGMLLSRQAFEVSHFCLFESHLGATGPSYSIVERYPLH